MRTPFLSTSAQNHYDRSRRFMKIVLSSVTFGLTLVSNLAQAQIEANWPSKPIRLIAVFPPGGSVDQVARALSVQLSAQLNQSVIVENKGGGAGSIGAASVAQAPGDGYTFGVVFDTHAVNPSLLPTMAFNTTKDLASVMLIGTSPMVLVAHSSQPYKSMRDVIAAAKAKPGAATYGTIGSGSLGHLAMTQISNTLGLEFVHVPYRGGGPLVADALGGQVPLSIGTVFLMNPHIKTGKLIPLGITSKKPDPQLPGVAPIAEQGIPALANFEALAWWGVIAPASTTPAMIKRMNEELSKALKTPAVAEKLGSQGLDIISSSPAQMDVFLRAEIERWSKVVRDNKIKAGD
jgi:tripartite-type tricarboxylate transporter receptor subunit TctC